MLALDRPAFDRVTDDFDEAVSLAPDLDTFCSQSAWTLAADAALMPPRELWCRRGEHGWALMARHRDAWGESALMPLEASWRLASPIVCTGDPVGLARELSVELASSAPLDVLLLSGLVAGSPIVAALAASLRDRYQLRAGVAPPTQRHRASLEGGARGFLSRRSTRLRERLRQAERKGERAGVTFEAIAVASEADAAALLERLLAVEARSWKGIAGDGLMVPEMAAFYREMLPRLARRGAVRAMVGRRQGEDVAVIVGAVTATPEGALYRGLQFSFDDAHRSLSLGNLAQLAQVRALAAEGVAVYDLGAGAEAAAYKTRWGERGMETVTLVAVPRARRFA